MLGVYVKMYIEDMWQYCGIMLLICCITGGVVMRLLGDEVYDESEAFDKMMYDFGKEMEAEEGKGEEGKEQKKDK